MPRLCPEAGIAKFQGMEGLFDPRLSYDSYEQLSKLDIASRNDVFTATLDGAPCVLKAYDLTSDADRRRAEREVLRLHKLRHRHIVRIVAAFVRSEAASMQMYLQMPEYKGGNLRQWLQAGEPNPQIRERLVFGVLQAVDRVHAAGILHNDMKLENVLLTDGFEDAVLSDFELSNTVGGATTTVVGGTPAYMAPERRPPTSANR